MLSILRTDKGNISESGFKGCPAVENLGIELFREKNWFLISPYQQHIKARYVHQLFDLKCHT